MTDDLLKRLNSAAELGMGVCAEAAREIVKLQRRLAESEAASSRSRNDALAIAFERQRQAAMKAQRDLEYAVRSQSYDMGEVEDPEEALKTALTAVTAIANGAEPEEVGAKLLDAARAAPALQDQVNSLRVARVATAGVDADVLRQEGIGCSVNVDFGNRIIPSWHGQAIAVNDGATTSLTLFGTGPGAKTLAIIGEALTRQ